MSKFVVKIMSKPGRHNPSNGIEKDKRFAKITSDPLFREISTKDRKIRIDERFQHMFEDDRFKIGGAKVDKRGRKFNLLTNDHLNALYDIKKSDESESDDDASTQGGTESDEEEIDLPIKVDLARGEGNVSSSSSDESETSGDEVDDDAVNNLTVDGDDWGELDRGVKRVDWTSRRVAICNLEWDRLSSDDILVVLNSFKPTSGVIKSVSIYLSDFGAQRIEEEEKKGPQLDKSKKKSNEATIRAYQLDRLRYYYAVCECDTAETAAALYENCDGAEYEMSGVRFDIRFVPDDMEFDESRLKERADLTATEDYKPKCFESYVLSNAKPKLTWDETDPERARSMHNAFKDENLGQHYQKLIAPPSDSEDDEDAKRNRLELLLKADDQNEERPTPDEDIRVDWDVPSSDATKAETTGSSTTKVAQGNDDDESSEDESVDKKGSKKTPFQEYLAKRKEKRKERKAMLREKKLQNKQEMKEMQEQNKKKSQKRRLPEKPSSDTLDLGDSRFAALFTDSAFAIDKTNSLYRGGDLAEQQAEKRSAKRRRPSKEDEQNNNNNAADALIVLKVDDAKEAETTETMVERIKRKMMKEKC